MPGGVFPGKLELRAGAQGQAAGVDAGTLIVSNKLSNVDFTAADRQVWIRWGGAKDCFGAVAKDCRLAVAKDGLL